MIRQLPEFADAALGFLRENVPRKLGRFFCGQVTDNFRVVKLSDFRVLT
jgi:hypothetical protein